MINKKNSELFSGAWHNHTHFRQKLNLGIFSKLCLLGVAYDLWKDYFKTFQTYSVNLRGVAGPYPFSENVCIIPILVSNKL